MESRHKGGQVSRPDGHAPGEALPREPDGSAAELIRLALRNLRHCMLIVDDQLSLVTCNALCGMTCRQSDRGIDLFRKVLSSECPHLRQRPEVLETRADMLEKTARRVLEGGHNEATLHFSCGEGERIIARNVIISALYHGGRIYAQIRFEDTSASEQALAISRQSEQQYTRLIENLPDCIVRFNEHLRIQYVSPNIYWLTGRRTEEYLNGPPESLISHPQSLLQFRQALETAAGENRTVEIELSLPLPVGTRTINCRVVPERSAQGKTQTMLAVLRDISEHRRMEGELRSLFTQIPVAMGVLDCVRDSFGQVVDFTVSRANPAVEQHLGLLPQNIIGRSFMELVPGADPAWFNALRDVADTGAPREMEQYARRLEPWLSVRIFRLNPDQVAAFATDVTARRVREQERASLAAALEQSEDGFLLLDANGSIQYANQAAARRYATDVQGQPVSSLLESPENTENLSRLAHALETVDSFTGIFLRQDPASRDKRTDEVKMTPVRDAEGRVSGYAVMLRDITDQIRRQSQMQHVQKLESIGVLAGGIAHDFNNLLMTILGNTDLAMQELDPSAGVIGYLKEIEKASQHAADLCRQLLAYAGKGQINVSTVDLNSLVEGMTRLLEISVSKKVVIRQNLFPGLPPVKGDSSQLRQVLMNLVLNASEAIGNKSGVILISTGIMNCDRQYLLGTFVSESIPEGDYVYIEVSDTGCGIPPQDRDRIFDPFFTTKFLGRGLGLAAVQGIIRGHGGAIKVYSEPGKGSTFKVLLPIADDAVILPVAARPESRWTSHGLVLLAEDEETVRAIGQRMLERMGFTVLTAVDGRDCLRIFQEHVQSLRLVVLDLTMPHLDGDEVFREIRRVRPDLPTIIASGYTEQEIRQRFAGKGIAGFIQKPYHFTDLRGVIRAALGE